MCTGSIVDTRGRGGVSLADTGEAGTHGGVSSGPPSLPAEQPQGQYEAYDRPGAQNEDRLRTRGEAGALVHDRAQRVVDDGERQGLDERLHERREALGGEEAPRQ